MGGGPLPVAVLGGTTGARAREEGEDDEERQGSGAAQRRWSGAQPGRNERSGGLHTEADVSEMRMALSAPKNQGAAICDRRANTQARSATLPTPSSRKGGAARSGFVRRWQDRRSLIARAPGNPKPSWPRHLRTWGSRAQLRPRQAMFWARHAKVQGKTRQVEGSNGEVEPETWRVQGKTPQVQGWRREVQARTPQVQGKTAAVSAKTADALAKNRGVLANISVAPSQAAVSLPKAAGF